VFSSFSKRLSTLSALEALHSRFCREAIALSKTNKPLDFLHHSHHPALIKTSENEREFKSIPESVVGEPLGARVLEQWFWKRIEEAFENQIKSLEGKNKKKKRGFLHE